MSADADPRRPSPNAVAVIVLVLLGAAVLLWQRPWSSSDDPAGRSYPDDAPSVLAGQFREAAAASSETAFTSAFGTSTAARTLAKTVWTARIAVDAVDVDLRYLSGGEAPDAADGSADVAVEVSWRPGPDSPLGSTDVRRSTVTFGVTPGPEGRFDIVRAGRGEGALPLWLAGAVVADAGSAATVLRIDGGDNAVPVDRLAARAVKAVQAAVPAAVDRMTVISPRTTGQMAALVGQDAADVRQIAAVTTQLDGVAGNIAGTVVVLNPGVFATMDQRAAQIVMTHEATHVLTRAPGTRAPSWVVEGFADYVALADDAEPLAVSAGQILAQTRDAGAPRRLPTAADFDATRHGLGAVYESAWLVFRMLGERYSDREIVGFYTAVRDGSAVGRALDDTLGVSIGRLTADWRAYLTKSASTVS